MFTNFNEFSSIMSQFGDGPYGGTNDFLHNFYYGFGGLGFWVIFLLLAIAAVIWLIYDSQSRHLPVLLWQIGVIVAACLILPAIIFRFTVKSTDVDTIYNLQDQIKALEEDRSPADWREKITALENQINDLPPLTGSQEILAYLGILGGLLAPAVGMGYYITYKDLTGCPNGHIYDASLGQCPDCARNSAVSRQDDRQFKIPTRQPSGERQNSKVRLTPSKPKANAWLVSSEGHSYQLLQDETTLGRSSRNDIQITSDTTLSKEHAKILEENGHFKLFDLGSTNGTYVNGKRVRQPVKLEADDEIRLADNTQLRFVTTQQ